MTTHTDCGSERDIGFLLKILADKLRKRADDNLSKIGLTYSQFMVLASIVRGGGSMTQKEIEKDLRVSHPTVVGLVSRLDEAGFVKCRIDERDRRNKIVSLTGKSIDIRDGLGREREKNEELLLNGVSQEERRNLRMILQKILGNLEEEEKMHQKS